MPILGIVASSKSGNLSGPAFDSIATATPNGTNTITFSSIPQNYSHLQIRFLGYSANGIYGIQMQFNADSSNSYLGKSAFWYGGTNTSGVVAYGLSSLTPPWNEAYSLDTNYGAFCDVEIEDYTNTSKFKTFRTFYSKPTQIASSNSETKLTIGTYTNSSAITSISIQASGGTFSTGTIAALYGIKG